MKRSKRVYASIGRLAYTALSPLIWLYVSEKQVRVRVLILNDQKEVLLVKSWLGHQRWTLPGGGRKRRETPQEAGVREVYEETGLRLVRDQLRVLGTFTNSEARAPFTIACLMAHVAKRRPHLARHRRLEMLDAAWFSLDHLPAQHSKTLDRALALLKDVQKKT